MRVADARFIEHEEIPNTWRLVNASGKFLVFAYRHAREENEIRIDIIVDFMTVYDRKMPLRLSYMELWKSDANRLELGNMMFFSMKFAENFIREMEADR